MEFTTYFVCGHFTHLALFKGMSNFLRLYFPKISQKLILLDNPHLSLVNHSEFTNGYDEIYELKYCETVQSSNWSNTLAINNVRKRVEDVSKLLDQLSEIKFNEPSMFVFTDFTDTSLSSRLLLKKIRSENNKVRIFRAGITRNIQKKYTSYGLMWFLINIYSLLGAPMVKVNMDGYIVANRRFYKESKYFDGFIVYSNEWTSNKDFIQLKYPVIDGFSKTPKNKKQYVLFAGHSLGPTSQFKEITKESYIETTNRILSVLSECYLNQDVDLYYKPHPREDKIHFELSGFEVLNEPMTSEMLFARDRSLIKAAYSVASSSSATAALMGVKSYALYKLYNYPDVLSKRAQRRYEFSDVKTLNTIKELGDSATEDSTFREYDQNDIDRLKAVFENIIVSIT